MRQVFLFLILETTDIRGPDLNLATFCFVFFTLRYGTPELNGIPK